MQTLAFIILSFFGAWLIAYIDHRAKFVELFYDIPGLFFGMLLAGFLLYLLYGLLDLAFHP